MKSILASILLILTLTSFKDPIVNTTWRWTIAKGCVNTYKFKPNNIIENYDCELDYKIKGTYKFSKDTLIVTLVDDSHPEDGGIVIIDRYKYFLVRNNQFLYTISFQRRERNKWDKEKRIHQFSDYKKINH